MTTSTWPPHCPPERLRLETRAMADACVEVLTSVLGSRVRAIHWKGSALKAWDSPIDYVPGLSDVDIHLLLAADADEAALSTMDRALEVNAAVLEAFRRRVPDPLHVPKPQLVLANRLDREPGILPSPAATVTTLYGEPYEDRTLTEEEQAVSLRRDREELLAPRAFIEALPLRVIDRPGPYLEPLLNELNWRVSPVAPRVVELAGTPYAETWSMNRTRLVSALIEAGQPSLAEAYRAYYEAGWRRYLEGEGGVPSRDVLRAGVEVMRLGAAFAESLPSRP
ncbi:MAG: hypothetical protein IT299_02830 [Dehalococcoidia bacterium]|nr:hypothetical protein [Dehalococcoidia bacterium]